MGGDCPRSFFSPLLFFFVMGLHKTDTLWSVYVYSFFLCLFCVWAYFLLCFVVFLLFVCVFVLFSRGGVGRGLMGRGWSRFGRVYVC